MTDYHWDWLRQENQLVTDIQVKLKKHDSQWQVDSWIKLPAVALQKFTHSSNLARQFYFRAGSRHDTADA